MKILCAPNISAPLTSYKGTSTKKTDSQPMNDTPPVSHVKDFKFSKELSKKIDKFYTEYEKSLGETTHNDIREAICNITEDTKYTPLEVLKTMQVLTQFANMRSVKYIADELYKNNVYSISNGEQQIIQRGNPLIFNYNQDIFDAFTNDFGANATLSYMIKSKGLGNLKDNEKANVAIFLDKHKLDALEKVQKENPDNFKYFCANKKFKFFILSGFNEGITFADRTLDLETETRKLLELSEELDIPVEDAIDYQTKKRAQKLGLNPIIIKREGAPTIHCVYKQMAPEKMTKNDLYNIIRINTQKRNPENSEYLNTSISNKTIDYLDENMKVYTPETFTKALKNLHTKIIDYAEEKGKTPEDIFYVITKFSKSDKAVNYFYSRINNIPESQYITLNELKNDDSRLYVVIDDCSLSGTSTNCMSNHMNCFMHGNKTDTLFAYVCGTDCAEDNFDKQNNTDIMFYEKIKTSKNYIDSPLSRAVGTASYDVGDIVTCLVLPYMSPDNNSDMGANIGALHNPVYRSYNHSQVLREETMRHGIKNYYDITKEILNEYYNSIGVTPEVEKSKKEKRKNFFSRIFKHP